jgi:hypothetical protein
MSFNAFPYVVSWAVLAFIVLGLAAYKLTLYMITSRQDFAPHIASAPPQSAQKAVVAHREEILDKWGKILTIVAIVYGLVIAVVYLYSALQFVPGRNGN